MVQWGPLVTGDVLRALLLLVWTLSFSGKTGISNPTPLLAMLSFAGSYPVDMLLKSGYKYTRGGEPIIEIVLYI
jgi:hypothetical protein